MMAGFWFTILLVGSQFCLCLGSCSVHNHTEVHRCNSLEKMFEKALISNEDNLYILRDAFDSNSHPSRNLILVTYIALMESPLQLYNVTIPWTNSRIYTIIHPTILFAFQSGILTMIYYYLEGVINTPNITLALFVENDRNITPSTAEVEHVLSTLTRRLQLYIYQSIPLEQSEVKLGFALPPTSFKITPWNKYTILMATATLLLVVTAFLFTCKFMTYFSQQMRDHKATHVKLTYFWSFVYVISFINSIEFLAQLAVTAVMYGLRDQLPILPIRELLMGIIIVASAIGMACGYLRNEKKLPPLMSYTKDSCFFCTLPCFIRYKYCTTMCNIYFFVCFVCVSVISTGIYVFVNPILVLSISVYIITSIFCYVAIFSLPVSMDYSLEKLFKSGNVQDFKVNCFYICNSVPFISLFIVVDLLMLLYLIIIYQLDITNSNNILQAALSFFPSLIVATLGYFTTKFTRRKLRNKFTEPDTELSVDTDSLKLAEEGRNLKENDAIIEEETVHLLKTVEDTEL